MSDDVDEGSAAMRGSVAEDDPIHVPITVTVRDSVTGEAATNSDYTPWHWAYGNGSCDCNRASLFGREQECGESRYYVVATERDQSGYTMDEDYNHNYPPGVAGA